MNADAMREGAKLYTAYIQGYAKRTDVMANPEKHLLGEIKVLDRYLADPRKAGKREHYAQELERLLKIAAFLQLKVPGHTAEEVTA